ncbi:MAG: hypothetical protein GY716_08430 [bacterium]|nr:hypothetical protein [bacterium]
MRIGDSTLYLRFLANLGFQRARTSEALDSLADNKRVRVASDDPVGSAESLALRGRLARLAGYDRAARSAQTDLATLEGVLGQVGSLLSEARTKAMAGASTPAGEPEPIRAGEIESLRDQLLALANKSQRGRYLFAGTETLTPPFGSDGSYAGNDDEVLAPLDSAEEVGVTFSGRSVFIDGDNLFALLDDVAQALRDGRSADVAAAGPRLDAALDRINEVHAESGFRLNRITNALDNLADEALGLTRRIVEIENIDEAEVILQLQSSASAAEALSAAAARVLGRSLFDYLR